MLVDRNLVRRDESPEGGVRLTMLETIREYALARLRQDNDEIAVRRRHAEYFVDLGVRAKAVRGSGTRTTVR